MTQNMRSPGNGFLGNIAKELMIVFNEFVYNDSIKKLNVKKNDNVIEIGSGNGQGIKKLLNLTSKNIISIEVSDTFRNKLIQKFKNQLIADGFLLLLSRANSVEIQDHLNSYLDPAIHFDIAQAS